MKACIFDLDGTLTNTLESIAYSINATLKEMTLSEITKEQCKEFVGDGARCLMERSLLAAGEKDISRIEEGMRIYGRIFDANCTYHVTPYKGIKQMLTTLKEKGIKLAVLSNKPHVQTVKVVESIWGEDTFDCVQGQQEGVEKKPNPEGIFYLLKKMGIEKGNCIYVGDSEVDIQTGNNANVRTIAVTWGFRGRILLEAAGAKDMADLPEELIEYAK